MCKSSTLPLSCTAVCLSLDIGTQQIRIKHVRLYTAWVDVDDQFVITCTYYKKSIDDIFCYVPMYIENDTHTLKQSSETTLPHVVY